MTDETLAGQAPEGEAPAAPPPAAPAPDIEARLTQFEERIKGFQKLVSEKDGALQAAQRQLDELQRSGMSDDEKAELEWQQLQERVNQLTQENTLLSLANEYPDEMPVFRTLLSAGTPQEQLDAIRALRASAKAAQAAPNDQENPAEGDPDIPDVDPNNPSPRPSSGGPTFNGQVMDDNWADRLLASVKRLH